MVEQRKQRKFTLMQSQRVGTPIDNFEFTTADGKTHDFNEVSDGKDTLLLFLPAFHKKSTGCLKQTKELMKDFKDKEVNVIALSNSANQAQMNWFFKEVGSPKNLTIGKIDKETLKGSGLIKTGFLVNVASLFVALVAFALSSSLENPRTAYLMQRNATLTKDGKITYSKDLPSNIKWQQIEALRKNLSGVGVRDKNEIQKPKLVDHFNTQYTDKNNTNKLDLSK